MSFEIYMAFLPVDKLPLSALMYLVFYLFIFDFLILLGKVV
jgi:hypothetical protein